jgi:hypothetical protein
LAANVAEKSYDLTAPIMGHGVDLSPMAYTRWIGCAHSWTAWGNGVRVVTRAEVTGQPSRDLSVAAELARIAERLTLSTFERPRDFAVDVTGALVDELGLVAASLYVTSPSTGGLKLKAATGFSYEDYESFQLPMHSYAGLAVVDETAYVTDEMPLDPELYRDATLLSGGRIGGIVATAFDSASVQLPSRAPHPLGCLCLYPKDASDLQHVADVSAAAATLIGTLYLSALDRYLMHLRSRIVRESAFKHDIGSLVRKSLEVFKEELGFEAGSAWILDPRRNRLYLRGSTGLASGRRLADYSVASRGANLIASVFHEVDAAWHTSTEQTFDKAKVIERLDGPLRNGAAIPIEVPEPVRLGGEMRSAVGVMVLLNHYTDLGGVRHITDFSWEDEAVARFGSEMIAVLIYQLLRTRDHESDYERQMHGARTNLQCAKSNLQFLQTRLNIEDQLPLRYQHYVANCIDWIEDLQQQINRDEFVMRDDLSVDRIGLYGSVLKPVQELAKRRAESERVILEFTGVDLLASRIEMIPFVRGNAAALQSVFRNLVDNSIKYRDPSSPTVRLDIRLRLGDQDLTVLFSDNGLGIGDHELDQVFELGYRGEVARRINIQGTGVGLHECRFLLKKMGGAIALDESLTGSRFSITLKRWEKN